MKVDRIHRAIVRFSNRGGLIVIDCLFLSSFLNPKIPVKSSPLRTLHSNDGSESQARGGGLFVHKMKMLIEVNVLSSTVINK